VWPDIRGTWIWGDQSSHIPWLFGRCACQLQQTAEASGHEKPHWVLASVVTTGHNELWRCIATRGISRQRRYAAVYRAVRHKRPTVTTNCSTLQSWMVSMWPFKCCDCLPQRTVTTSDRKNAYPNSYVLGLSSKEQQCSPQPASSAIPRCPLSSIRPLIHTSIDSVCIRHLGSTILFNHMSEFLCSFSLHGDVGTLIVYM